MGVTGGSPLGFDVGARGAGGTLRGLDLGVQGMRVGGRRKLIVPPELGYGNRGEEKESCWSGPGEPPGRQAGKGGRREVYVQVQRRRWRRWRAAAL